MDGEGTGDGAGEFLLKLIILQIYTLLSQQQQNQEQHIDEIAHIKYKCTNMNLRWEQVNLNFIVS